MVGEDEAVGAVAKQRRAIFRRRFLSNPFAIFSITVLTLVVLAGLLSPWIMPFDPSATRLDMVNAKPGGVYLFGGDGAGRDILSRLIAGVLPSLGAAAIVASVAALVGIPLGLLAGFYPSRVGAALTWIFNLVQAFPTLIFLIGIYAALGHSTVLAMVVFGIMISVVFFRLVRGLANGVRNELYVDAARVSGVSDPSILFRHVFGVIKAPAVIAASFIAGAGVTIQAGLAFIGLSNANEANWGNMLANAFLQFPLAPLQIVWPALALGLTVASFVLLGTAIRDASGGVEQGKTKVRQTTRETLVRTEDDSDVLPTQEVHIARGAASLLDISDVTIQYRRADGSRTTVVDGVSLAIARGEVLGLVGQSGSGKTQLAYALLGLLSNAAELVAGSRMSYKEETLTDRRRAQLRGREIAYIPQEPMSNLYPSATIGSQMSQGVRVALGISRKAARQRVLELLDRVEIADPARMYDLYPHEVSGGMAQRALIAGAIASSPSLLIADEPTTALDVTVQAEILDLLRDLQKEMHMGVLLVTHNFGVIADLSDRVAVMSEGRIVEQGTTANVLGAPHVPYTRKLIGALLENSPVRKPLEPQGTETSSPLLDITDLTVAYTSTRGFKRTVSEVLHGVSLTVKQGECLGIVGESGSGKTTIGRAILGLVAPSAGSIEFGGTEISTLGKRARRKLADQIQVVFQDPFTSLNPAMAVLDILGEPLIAHGYRVRDAQSRVRELLDRVGLPRDAAHRLPREFSGGQRQRIAIARALALKPKLIVCDEPVSALDLVTQAQVLDLLIEVQETTGVAYVFVTHDLSVVRYMSHRVAVIEKGLIVEEGPTDAVTESPQAPYTQRLVLSSPVADSIEQRERRMQRKELFGAYPRSVQVTQQEKERHIS